MHLDFTPEQKQLRSEIRVLARGGDDARSASPPSPGAWRVATWSRSACERSVPLICSASAGRKNMADGGFTALEQFIFFEEAQRLNTPIPLVTLNTVGPTLAHCGTEEQKQKFLPSILNGTVEFAIGYSEPSAGSDLASLRTTAVRDGDDYVINGQKMFTSGAAYADYVWLAARTDPRVKKHKGISIFIVPSSLARILLEAAAHHAGRRPRSTRSTTTCGCPRHRSSAGENEGWQLITDAAELRARRAGQHGCARAAVREDVATGRRPPNSTAAASSTSHGCSRRWPESRPRSPRTRS